eukprot:scaffold44255_cov75-Phaeocystis_antarctica.AAC.2
MVLAVHQTTGRDGVICTRPGRRSVSRPQRCSKRCSRLMQLAARRPADMQVDAALPRELRHKVVLPRAAQRAQVDRGVA